MGRPVTSVLLAQGIAEAAKVMAGTLRHWRRRPLVRAASPWKNASTDRRCTGLPAGRSWAAGTVRQCRPESGRLPRSRAVGFRRGLRQQPDEPRVEPRITLRERHELALLWPSF